nr:MAG TPA: tail protein [Caudoviricetes sp.]
MRNGKSRTEYMELNTINKTGTWSETADRINSNFSKISIEVEEIKQNGGGGSGGGGDVTNADHATSAYTLDKNTPVLDWFLSALNDDDAQGIINFLKGLKISGNLVSRIVKQGDKDVTYTDEDVMSALRVMIEIENSVEKMKEIFLRKDVADSTKFLLSMFAGAVFGKNGFASGLTGFGAKIFDTGHGEFESMFIRRFLEVPELRYNRVMVTLGDKWRAPGAGIIETVDTGTKTCTLKLEDGEIGAVAVGDICMGIYHNITGNATEDYDDGKGNRRFAGFCTVYFTITEVTGERNETFKYQLRPTSSSWSSSFDPFEMMNFVAYGNFTDTDRQTSVYETRTYTRMLWKQNTWEISAANVALQYGDLSNLNIFGLNMDGYSMYLNNIYMTGIIKQIKPDGTPVQTLNFREEGYIPGVHYDYYDSLSYKGSMWACINEDGSSAAPGSNGDWLEIASKGDTGTPGTPGKDGVSVTNSGPWYSGLVVPKMSIVTMGGSSFLSKVSTTNPPLWCWTDNAGNRFTFNDGGYCLTGEVNTAEYDVWAEKGEPGKDGTDGKDGEDGKDGKPGEQGIQGIQGCIIRSSEWASGVTYRNDEDLTSGTRYIDIVMVRNNSAVDGWDVYKCIKTHTSSSSITYTNTTYWTELSNVGPIYTSLIIAKNASLNFVQGNELLIKDSNNNVVAGLTGGSSKEAGTTPIRIWAGGKVPGSAPFRVDQNGNLVATKANIGGTVTATLLYSPGSDMDSLADSEGNMTVNPSTQGSTFFSADGLGGTITLPPASSWNGLKLEFVVDMTSRVPKNPDKYKATNYFCGLAGAYNNKTEIQMARPYVLEMKAFNNHWYITRMDLI